MWLSALFTHRVVLVLAQAATVGIALLLIYQFFSATEDSLPSIGLVNSSITSSVNKIPFHQLTFPLSYIVLDGWGMVTLVKSRRLVSQGSDDGHALGEANSEGV